MPRSPVHPDARKLKSTERNLVALLERLGNDLLQHPDNDALRCAIDQGEISDAQLLLHLMTCLYQVLFLKATGQVTGSRPPLRTWHDVCAAIMALAGDSRMDDSLWGTVPNHCRGIAVSFSDAVLADILAVHDQMNTPAEFDACATAYPLLLNYEPVIDVESGEPDHCFALQHRSGRSRKQRGSYYTPDELVETLIDKTLDPALEQNLAVACDADSPRDILLQATVCDPACGSGHFLLAAAHRIVQRIMEREPAGTDRAAALQEVIAHCVYGVDVDPFAVALCRAGLWLHTGCHADARAPLESHIRTGNALLGASPDQIANGIPNEAFNRPKSDHPTVATYYRKRNRRERVEDAQNAMPASIPVPRDAAHARFIADAWCAAFTWSLHDTDVPDALPGCPGAWNALTHSLFRQIQHDPESIPRWMREEIQRLAQMHHFFHWHLEFPAIFASDTSCRSAPAADH